MLIANLLADRFGRTWAIVILGALTLLSGVVVSAVMPVTLTGIAITRMRAGQMAENWNETDDLGLLQQLGVIPAPGQ